MMKTLNDPLDRSFLSSSVVNELRKRLILNQIPKGQKLVELQISEELNVSRGPVRNALLLLEKEGLVRFLSNGRTEAVGFSMEDAEKLYETRLYLETKAIEMACVNTAKDIHALNNSLTELKQKIHDMSQFSQMDIQFHFELVKLSGNKYLVQCWSTLKPLLETILFITNSHFKESNEEHDWEYIFDLHEKLMKSLIMGDLYHSVAYIREHLESGKVIMFNTLKQIL